MIPTREVALRVMRDLAEWSSEPPDAANQRFSRAKFGLAGIEAYATDCADMATYSDWSACHDINPQWTIRSSTGVYLESVAGAGLFAEPVNVHLRAAAEHYRAAFADWHESYDLLGHGAPEGAGKMNQRRLAGSAAAQRWLEHEKAAIAEIRHALSLLAG